MKYIPEPFKIKSVEPIKMTTREEREKIMKEAHYNAFALPADKVYIDLQTDSGTGAMSNAQWSALMMGDESYSGGKSYFHLMDVANDIFKYAYVQPVHQGRAAEKVLMPLLVKKPGQFIISNTFFDTTRAHVGLAGGMPIDNLCVEGRDSAKIAPFKGNMNIPELEKLINQYGAENVVGIVQTVTNNSVGGQPVSMQNMRETYAVAQKYGIPLIIDAARYAENAFFIHEREEGYQDKTLREIVAEMFSYGDIFTMSAKKNALINMGGLIGVKDNAELIDAIKSRVISFEGYLTYGGLSGRELETLAVGLDEGLDLDFQRYRIGQVAYLGAKLDEYGVPYQSPAGGHAIFVDAGKLLPHIPWHQYPGQALSVELYLEAGIRACDIGSFLMDRNPRTGEQQQAMFEFTRMAIPCRVYTQAHMDICAEALKHIKEHASNIPGYEITWEPKVLRHFTSKLKPIGKQ